MYMILHSNSGEHARTETYKGHPLFQLLPSSIMMEMKSHFDKKMTLSFITSPPSTLMRSLIAPRRNWTRCRLRGGDTHFSGDSHFGPPTLRTYLSLCNAASSSVIPWLWRRCTALSLMALPPATEHSYAETQSSVTSPAVNVRGHILCNVVLYSTHNFVSFQRDWAVAFQIGLLCRNCSLVVYFF